jgi:penicillin-insensitive murein endopeptidase
MRILALAMVTWSGVALAEPSPAELWGAIKAPSHGAAQAIGGYSAGCLDGATALPLTGEGFRVAKPERNRVFGHPLLVALIRDVGHLLSGLELGPLSVGDLAQPRGGPAPSGHASHQSGLDVDLWFLPPVGPVGKATAQSMIDAARKNPSPRFDAKMVKLLELVASDARVDRIFVHPVLKRAVCERATDHPTWLRKLRPWWGHDDHFHVRLACPADSPACVAQAPLPPGDGCDQLSWWFDEKAQADRQKEHQSYSSRVGAAAELPEKCRALLAP